MLELGCARRGKVRMNRLAAAWILAVGLCGVALAQDGAPARLQGEAGMGRGMRREFHGVGGQITAIEGSTITLQTFRGDVATVKVTSSTQILKDGDAAKLIDFKVGDRVFAAGDQDANGVWTARMLGQRRGGRGSRGEEMGGMQARPEDNGKTYIRGELIKIDGTNLTVKKPDNTEQVIEVDDDTSFRNERRESMTFPDVKIGDFVRGRGAVKSGVFVAAELYAGRARGVRQPTVTPTPDGAMQGQNQTAPDSHAETK